MTDSVILVPVDLVESGWIDSLAFVEKSLRPRSDAILKLSLRLFEVC